MSIFVIGDGERAAIKAAMARARAHPVELEEVMRVADAIDQASDRVTLAERAAIPGWRDPEIVMLPFGYRLNISYEHQPAGLCLHLSMSSPRTGMLPRPEAIAMVLEAMDIDPRTTPARTWMEEFMIDDKPGGHAINLVAVIEPAIAGRA